VLIAISPYVARQVSNRRVGNHRGSLRHACFHQNQDSNVVAVVENFSNHKILGALAAARGRTDRSVIDLNPHSEICSCLLNQTQQIVELVRRIGVPITCDDQPAATPDEFVYREILKVSTIGEIYVFLLLIALCK